MAAVHLSISSACIQFMRQDATFNCKRSAYTTVHIFWRRILNSIFKRHSTQTVTANTIIHKADGD